MNEDRVEGGGRTVKDRAETALGTVQDGYDRARDKVREMLDNAPTVREAVATGRDYYRRGADVVTRNATDSTALTLLAAGVAVAAVSWLILGRRGGKDAE